MDELTKAKLNLYHLLLKKLNEKGELSDPEADIAAALVVDRDIQAVFEKAITWIEAKKKKNERG